MWWAKLDNTDGSIAKKSESRSSKWEFRGTYDELIEWLPEANDQADWTLLRSDKPSLGYEWAGEDFLIDNIRYTAMNRFLWIVNVIARYDEKSQDFNNKNPGKVEEEPLGSRVDVDVGNGTFTLTEEMTGYRRDDQEVWKDVNVIKPGSWVLASDCPFTARPNDSETNKTYSCATITVTRYFRGTPVTNGTANANFSGIVTVRIGSSSKKGLVVGQQTGKVYDNEGDIFTSLSATVLLAPAGKTWNSNWQPSGS